MARIRLGPEYEPTVKVGEEGGTKRDEWKVLVSAY